MKYCSSCRASYPLDYSACPRDQTLLQLVTDLMPGLVLRGKYEIIEKLGAGGMGAVYKARHVAFGELRAVKFVGAHLLESEQALQRFRSEAVLARRLQHQNAVRVEDLDATDDGRPFIVMEYVKGRSVRDLFQDEGDVATRRVLSLARQACEALSAAHALGIVHRDIKPDNLMVVADADGKEVLKVADFGLAKVRSGFDLGADNAKTETGAIVGTPPYMSPEQASGLEVDGRSDLYSLGIVIYELFTGRLPFRSDSPIGMLIHHRETPPEPPARLGVPAPLADFLTKALAKRREERFQTAEQMGEALRHLSTLTLPEFVGQGIREGFDPRWAGSRQASRVTTIQMTPPPTRSMTPPGARRPAPPRVQAREDEPAEAPSPARFWMGLGALALVGAWLISGRTPPAATPAPSPRAEPTVESPAPAPVAAPSSEPGRERTDAAIRFDIERLLADSTALRGARIQVEVANGVATLLGEAPSQTEAQLAATLASTVQGVRQVFGTLRVPAAAETAAGSSAPAGAVAEPARPAPPPPSSAPPSGDAARGGSSRTEDASREQVRLLLDRAREKMEARNPDAAESDLREVLRLDPNNPIAKDALEKLKNRPGPPPPRPPGPF